MNELPSYVVRGRVLYCGEPNWAYIGKDPDSGKPVLRNTITGSFIAADEDKITKPFDHEHELLCDIEVIGSAINCKAPHMYFIELISGLVNIGYTNINDPEYTKQTGFNTLTNMIDWYKSNGFQPSVTDIEYDLAARLYKLGFRKNKIVVAS